MFKSVIEMLQERKQEKEFLRSRDEAKEEFEKKRKSIKEISETDGFQALIDYLDGQIVAHRARRRGRCSEDKLRTLEKEEWYEELKEWLLNMAG